ncbi:MAG: Fic family protein [Clostridiales Family XIII bacterium]|jgi:Fic family protein|nr:Fic family protein [Clostridiales Family XIII bacterium]
MARKQKYIYDRADWPDLLDLQWNGEALGRALADMYQAHGKLFGKLELLGFSVQKNLSLESVSSGIIGSFGIEGEKLDMDGVRSSVAHRLGMESSDAAGAFPDRYTEGVVDMALDAIQNYDEPMTQERLFGWHAALFPTGHSGFRKISVAAYRTGGMEVVSEPLGSEKVHYAAPPPAKVPAEMDSFLAWTESPERGTDPFVRAGLAHLRFVSIHPFDDGNGRIGRAIADMMLARAEGSTDRYYSLSNQMLAERREYYRALENAQRETGDIAGWLIWFLGCLARAMRASESQLELAVEKARLFEKWRGIPMNERQVSMLNLLLDGFEGKMRSSIWAKLTKCSHDTALRDIEGLVSRGVLAKEGGGRSTSYALVR